MIILLLSLFLKKKVFEVVFRVLAFGAISQVLFPRARVRCFFYEVEFPGESSLLFIIPHLGLVIVFMKSKSNERVVTACQILRRGLLYEILT